MPKHKRDIAPQRMSPQRANLFTIYCISFMNLTTGFAYASGGRANAASLNLLSTLIPIRWWGAALFATSVLLILADVFGKVQIYAIGFGLGFVCWAVYAVAVCITFFNGASATSGGPGLIIGIALLHFIAMTATVSRIKSGAS